MSPRARRRDLTLLATRALALGLTQRGLGYWSSGVVYGLLAVLASRVGFFSVVAGYMVPSFIFHAFPVTHGNG